MNHYIYPIQSIDALINGEDDQLITITCPDHGDYRLTVGQHMDGYGCVLCRMAHGSSPVEKHKWAYTEQRVISRNNYGHINIHTVRIYTGYVDVQPICVAGFYNVWPRPIQRLAEHTMEVMVTAATEEEAKAKGERQIACYILKQLGPSALRATALETKINNSDNSDNSGGQNGYIL